MISFFNNYKTDVWLPQCTRFHIADIVGFVSALIIVFTGTWLGGSINRLAWGILLLAFFVALREFWPVLRRNLVFWASVVFIAYLGLRHGISLYEQLDVPVKQGPETGDLLRTSALIFIIGALFVRDNIYRIRLFLLAALTGLSIWFLQDLDWNSLFALDWDSRRLFGPGNPNQIAMALSFALIGFFVAVIRVIYRAYSQNSLFSLSSIVTILGYLLLLSFVAWTLIITGSRNAWIGSVGGIIAASFLLSIFLPSSSKSRWKVVSIVAVASCITIVLATLALFQTHHAKDRAIETVETIQQYLTDPDAAAEDPVSRSVALRIEFPRVGIEAWKERPLLGWGTEMNYEPVQEARPGQVHFHNLYIEVLYALGAIGAILYFGTYLGLFTWAATSLRHYGRAAFPAIFAISSATSLAIMLLATVRVHQSFGRTVFFFVGVCLASFYIGSKLRDYYAKNQCEHTH
ncbi:O-antigen ligase family protein [Halorhodospira halochloris]|uniref:O-antigen ligase family protein n=1 Tax=Halorhodospira halochloris TaxID=1052 RepID=UPI00076F718B|nr:O-antigen ligase family protein [Halorhodospira halochloris]